MDTFGDPETFGKQIAGDIIENKKTYLYLQALKLADKRDQQKLQFFYNQKLEDNSIKITEVTRIFEMYDLPILIKAEIESFTEKAFETLQEMDICQSDKENLRNFGLWLMNRTV